LRVLDGLPATLKSMDVLAIAMGLATFAILIGALRLIERI
jgi:hypothetical protein